MKYKDLVVFAWMAVGFAALCWFKAEEGIDMAIYYFGYAVLILSCVVIVEHYWRKFFMRKKESDVGD